MIFNQLEANNIIVKNQYQMDKTSDSPLRSIVKTVAWRTLGTLDTITIAWFLTNNIKIATSIGFIEIFTKIVLYFLHERFWNKVKWGKL